MPDKLDDINHAWVVLYDDKGFKDRQLRLEYAKDPAGVPSVKQRWADGKKGFNDKASSAKWQIPVGWEAVLFDDENYKDSTFGLRGNGRVQEVPDLGSFSDKMSSMRWEQIPD